ncbi:MAG TPA: hypothetical protein VFK42_05850 [Acidimicrobiales bacterium]|nr:hypothetical protein [Acidimicrobiales bacterium]
MKRAAVLLVLTLIAAVAVDMIGDKTQTRPDVVRPGSTSEVVFSLRTKMDRDRQMTANALWGACQGTVDSRVLDPGVVRLDESTFRITLAPELGHHARTRLTGCIEDATLDRVVADVHRITNSE